MNRERQIELFDDFRESMLSYFSSYKEQDEKKKKSTTSHRIAIELSKKIDSANIDLELDGVDILAHRDNKPILALFWSYTYLTEKDKERARLYHIANNPSLTLAFSLLEEKDYILVYRFEKDYLEYLHINKADFSESLLKRCLIEKEKEADDGQLLLDIPKTKKKRIKSQAKKKETEAQHAD